MSIESCGAGKMPRKVYTVEEVGQLLGLSRNTAYVAARNGELPVPTIRIGRRMVISKAALDRFLDAGERGEVA